MCAAKGTTHTVQKFLFLNLPANDKITRRYMCSYQSPTSLFPPLELLSLAAVYRNLSLIQPSFIDAVAENKSIKDVLAYIKSNNITHIISLIGFECFDEDIAAINAIKEAVPNITFIVFGHYPTVFSDEILEKSSVDIIMQGEPEEVFIDNYEKLSGSSFRKTIWAKGFGSAVNQHRIKDYESLPIPAYDLVKHNNYHEPMMAQPFGMIQSARGCPYACNYCVRSFGTRLTLRSPEKVVEEIMLLQKLHGIKSIRFIDDTFTVNRQRVHDICRLINEKEINIEWSCLSRTDKVDPEMLGWMKKAGCKRIYYGIENASQRILDFYKKGINITEAFAAVQHTNAAGIETAGFFMLGLPEETEEDFKLNQEFIAAAKFDYVAVGGLIAYPGTQLFDIYKDQIEFSLFPYVNRFKDSTIQKRYLQWNQKLYGSFLKSPHFIKNTFVKTLQSPKQSLTTLYNAVNYNYTYKHGVFHHIQKHKSGLSYFEK